MKKAFALMMCILLLFSSCSKKEEGKGSIVIEDDLGRRIEMEAPERVAALTGSLAQIWMLAGGSVAAAADDAWVDLGLDLDESTVNLGKLNRISLEKLLEADPDFIIATPNLNQDVSWKESFEQAGIAIAYFEVYSFSDYLGLLKLFTGITGREDLYRKNGLDVKESIDKTLALNRSDSPKVLSLLASSAYLKAKNSEGSVLGGMLRDLGCVNIADSDESLLENLSIEYILKEDPEYIFITQRGDDMEGMKRNVEAYFKDHPAWSGLSAVRNSRVYYLDKRLFNLKPNDRWGEAYAILQEILLNE